MNLSHIMLAELQYIRRHPLPIARLNKCHQATLKALIRRKLIIRSGDYVELTEYGELVATDAKLNQRKHEDKLSESVAAMLRVSRILQMRRAS